MRCLLPHCRLRWIALLLHALPTEAKRKSSISSLDEFWTFVAVIYGLVFLPVLFYFVYSLCRDPAAAEVLSLAKQWLRRKTLGFLSDGREVSVHSQRLDPPRSTSTSTSASSSAIRRKHNGRAGKKRAKVFGMIMATRGRKMKRTRAALKSEEEEEVMPRRSSQKQKKTTRPRRGVEDSDDDVIGSQPISDDEEPSPTATQTSDRRTQDESDDPDEFDGTLDFTQPDYAMTQPVASQTPTEGETTKKPPSIPSRVGQLSDKAIDDLTAQLVRYMLYKAGLKLPIKFADISKEVYPKYKNVSRYFFQKAKQQLETVFGYEVVAVNDNSSKELYLVLNACKSQEHLLLVNKNDRSATRGFLMMVLGLLWCASGRQLSEEDLWKQLALLDSSISPNRDHKQLGDVAQLLKTFENQLYLNSSLELDGDLKKVRFYSYGARTHLEVGKLQILNFVCKLITGRPPTEHQISELNLENN